jgi:glycosyltransferase involved in cell wall biosynthesis
MKLSILIPTTPERYETVVPLLKLIIGELIETNVETYFGVNNFVVRWQSNKHGGVEVVMYSDEKTLTLGDKRERLYQLAQGEYSWQIDSDDMIAENAIEKILEAIDNKPDCITFQEKCMMNCAYYTSNHSLKYDKWSDNHDGYNYTRTPFYKDVIKTEIARSVPFPHIRYNEDEQWSMALKPHLKTEVHIDEELYYYIYNSQPEEHNSRYGIK